MRSLAGIFGTLGLLVACSSAPAGGTQTASPRNFSTATAPAATPAAIGPTPTATARAGASTPASAYLQLLTYVPEAIANTCTEFHPTAGSALAVANCKPDDIIGDPDVYIDSVVYLLYDADFKTLDAWADRWEDLGEPTGSECSAGPSTNIYTVDGQGVGRIVCGPDPNGGLVAWWYDNRLKVVMSVLILEGTYEDLANLVGLTAAQP
jgi:hypothetical protein